MTDKGIPELCRIFDQLAATKDKQTVDDLLFVLKILAMYRTEAGTDRVIRAAKMPLNPEAYMWSVILAQYKDEHPQADKMLKQLGNPLPKDFLAVALLDCATGLAIAGVQIEHPFNSAEGIKRLRAWLASRDEDEYSYAPALLPRFLSSACPNGNNSSRWRSTTPGSMCKWKERGPRRSWAAPRGSRSWSVSASTRTIQKRHDSTFLNWDKRKPYLRKLFAGFPGEGRVRQLACPSQ